VIRYNSRYDTTETQRGDFIAGSQVGRHEEKMAIHLNPRLNKQYDRNKKMLSSSNGISYSISTLKSVNSLKCHQAF